MSQLGINKVELSLLLQLHVAYTAIQGTHTSIHTGSGGGLVAACMGHMLDALGQPPFPKHSAAGRGWEAWRVYVAGAAAIEANTNAAVGGRAPGLGEPITTS